MTYNLFRKLNVVGGFREADMDKLMGSDSLMTHGALVQMARDREREMQVISRTEHLLTGNARTWLSLYARAMTKLGEKLVLYGTRLKSHYSVHQAYHAQ
jgi:hypothetical protein